MTVQHKTFRSAVQSWQRHFDLASEFATTIGPERVISISHSQASNTGVVVVWYWGDGTSSMKVGREAAGELVDQQGA